MLQFWGFIFWPCDWWLDCKYLSLGVWPDLKSKHPCARLSRPKIQTLFQILRSLKITSQHTKPLRLSRSFNTDWKILQLMLHIKAKTQLQISINTSKAHQAISELDDICTPGVLLFQHVINLCPRHKVFLSGRWFGFNFYCFLVPDIESRGT